MRRALQTTIAAGAITLAIPATAFGADFLPESATYDGGTNHGGDFRWKVSDHRVVRMTGSLPLPKGQTCQYAAKRRIPLRLPQHNPLGSGPFTMRATQRVNPGTSKWRRLELRLSGQFRSDASGGTGTLRVKVFDGEGKCATRQGLAWHLDRR